MNVTCETAPHYLAFTQDDLQEDGRFKMNPPLRDQADQDALIEGLLDGTIDMLVTDHAPHSHEEKSKGLEKSAMGVVGLETSFAASYTHLVKKGILPLEKLVELMHTSPMRRFGCGTEIAVGQPADLTVFDLNGTYTVDPETFLTMGRATPFAGTCLTGDGTAKTPAEATAQAIGAGTDVECGSVYRSLPEAVKTGTPLFKTTKRWSAIMSSLSGTVMLRSS